MGMACKCIGRRNYGHLRDPFPEKRNHRNNLRHVSTVPIFKRGLPRWRSVSGNNRILSMDVREESRSMLSECSKFKRVPVYVMMPIDSFGIDTSGAPRIRKIKALTISLKALKLAGVHGIAVEVWWGVVENFPLEYNWSLYEELFKLISETGLKLQVALSFHSNIHLSSSRQGVGLPKWIMEIGQLNKDIYYRDQNGFSNDDYLTLGVDHHPLFNGRTALQCYKDFMFSFVNKFEPLMGTLIEEVNVGLGPCGELRYPAHPLIGGRWQFPGIGEFQCYDKYMMEDLGASAYQKGNPEWGDTGPQNAGGYNSFPSGVPFFEEGQGSFVSDYGQFFLVGFRQKARQRMILIPSQGAYIVLDNDLSQFQSYEILSHVARIEGEGQSIKEWYSDRLIRHADDILAMAANMLEKYQEDAQKTVLLVAKIGLIYWWYQTLSHPAELTAGYYNTAFRDGYEPLASMLSRHGAALQISCFEMVDNDTPSTYLCSPEGVLQQIRTVSKKSVVGLTGRNTFERFDKAGLRQIHANCYNSSAEAVRSFTYFRMNDKIFRVENWNNFVPFVRMMSTDM